MLWGIDLTFFEYALPSGHCGSKAITTQPTQCQQLEAISLSRAVRFINIIPHAIYVSRQTVLVIYCSFSVFILYFHRSTGELQMISFFWPLRSFIIDFSHQLFLMATLDQWVQPSSFKWSQGLFVVLKNYWSNHTFHSILVLEGLFRVPWIYLHCVSSESAKYTCEWFSRLHAVFEIYCRPHAELNSYYLFHRKSALILKMWNCAPLSLRPTGVYLPKIRKQ